MQASNLEALRDQQVAQHPAARKRIVEMQFVHPPHQRQISRRDRLRLIVEAAPADPELLGLPGQRQIMRAIDHRFALGSSPALPSACSKKSLARVNSPILACSVFTSTAGWRCCLLSPEHAGGSVEELGFPLGDLVGMHIELLGQLGQGLLALHGSQGHFGLESR
jgi:hypothetical protein